MDLHHHTDRKYNANNKVQQSVAGGHELPINSSLYQMIIYATLHLFMFPWPQRLTETKTSGLHINNDFKKKLAVSFDEINVHLWANSAQVTCKKFMWQGYGGNTEQHWPVRHCSHIFGVLTVSNLSVFYRLHNCSQVAYTTDLPHLALPQEYLVVMDYIRELHSSTLQASQHRHAAYLDAWSLMSQEWMCWIWKSCKFHLQVFSQTWHKLSGSS